MQQIKYKIYSEIISQVSTTINLRNIPDSEIYNHVTETLYERFEGYRIKINHAGRTVKVELK